MTKVISLARLRVARTVQTAAQNQYPTSHQTAIENALSMALHYVRGGAPDGLHAATAKTNRAFSLLKQSCEAAAANKREA